MFKKAQTQYWSILQSVRESQHTLNVPLTSSVSLSSDSSSSLRLSSALPLRCGLVMFHINRASGRRDCIVSAAPGPVWTARGIWTLGSVQSLSQSVAELKATRNFLIKHPTSVLKARMSCENRKFCQDLLARLPTLCHFHSSQEHRGIDLSTTNTTNLYLFFGVPQKKVIWI